jgi:hypothetical protein
MQIRKDPKPFGMTGLSSVSSGLARPPWPAEARPGAPLGGRPAKTYMRKPLKFSG